LQKCTSKITHFQYTGDHRFFFYNFLVSYSMKDQSVENLLCNYYMPWYKFRNSGVSYNFSAIFKQTADTFLTSVIFVCWVSTLCDPKFPRLIYKHMHNHTPNSVDQKWLKVLMLYYSVFLNLNATSSIEPLLLRLWSSWMWHWVIWYKASSVLEQLAAFIFLSRSTYCRGGLF
jgi:hypothetical protein